MMASARGAKRGRRRTAPRPAEPGRGEKLQKVLAAQGVGSRRELEEWITAGRVSVNGEVAHLGQRVGRTDKIEVDGKRVVVQAGTTEVLLVNKPAGVVCTRRDEAGRATVFDDLPRVPNGRWVTVGRLDVQTTGLLLLTNDGALAHRLMHPSTGLDREYAVRIDCKLEEEELAVLTSGVELDGEHLQFSDIQFYNGSGTNFWYHVVVMEGRNREVRRLLEHVGCRVSRLKRVRFGPVILPSWLRAGQWTSLQSQDVAALARLLGLRVNLPARQRRARVAKTSCLIPYPELHQ